MTDFDDVDDVDDLDDLDDLDDVDDLDDLDDLDDELAEALDEALGDGFDDDDPDLADLDLDVLDVDDDPDDGDEDLDGEDLGEGDDEDPDDVKDPDDPGEAAVVAVQDPADDDAEAAAPGAGDATALVEDPDTLLDDLDDVAPPLARDLDVDDEVREGEFVCRSCFMAKRESALADEERQLCRDCV